MKTVLSVDVAKNKSMIMLMNSDGEILIDTKEIKHNLEDFEKAKEEIKEISPEKVEISASIDGGPHIATKECQTENDIHEFIKEYNI